jgi:hypothetical protein
VEAARVTAGPAERTVRPLQRPVAGPTLSIERIVRRDGGPSKPRVAVVKEKLAKLVPVKAIEKEVVEAVEEVEEVAGIGTVPTYRLLLLAAVISLVVVGVATLFFVLFRPVEEEATVALATEDKPGDEKPLDKIPVDAPTA